MTRAISLDGSLVLPEKDEARGPLLYVAPLRQVWMPATATFGAPDPPKCSWCDRKTPEYSRWVEDDGRYYCHHLCAIEARMPEPLIAGGGLWGCFSCNATLAPLDAIWWHRDGMYQALCSLECETIEEALHGAHPALGIDALQALTSRTGKEHRLFLDDSDVTWHVDAFAEGADGWISFSDARGFQNGRWRGVDRFFGAVKARPR